MVHIKHVPRQRKGEKRPMTLVSLAFPVWEVSSALAGSA